MVLFLAPGIVMRFQLMAKGLLLWSPDGPTVTKCSDRPKPGKVLAQLLMMKQLAKFISLLLMLPWWTAKGA